MRWTFVVLKYFNYWIAIQIWYKLLGTHIMNFDDFGDPLHEVKINLSDALVFDKIPANE